MNLFIFGLGFSGRTITERRLARGDTVTGTVRSREKAAALSAAGITAACSDRTAATTPSMPISRGAMRC